MKKKQLLVSVLLAGLLLGLSACGNNAAAGGQDAPASQEAEADAQETEDVEQKEETAEEVAEGEEQEEAVPESTGQEDDAAAEAASAAETTAADAAAADTSSAEVSAKEDASGSSALVVYFSRVGNTDFPADIDADSSASIRIDGDGLAGNAGQIAAWIAEEAGCETMEILTEEPYPVDYNETVNQAKQEQNEGFRPMLKADEKAVEDYDTIYLSFPNWWGDLPMAVYSFLDAHDLSGKTVYVFVTHEGSGFSNTVGTIAGLEPDAEVLEGLAVQGGSVTDAEQNIRQWAIDHQN